MCMKTRIIEYESDTLIPTEVASMFKRCEGRILRDNLEEDKLVMHLGGLKAEILNWLDDNLVVR